MHEFPASNLFIFSNNLFVLQAFNALLVIQITLQLHQNTIKACMIWMELVILYEIKGKKILSWSILILDHDIYDNWV